MRSDDLAQLTLPQPDFAMSARRSFLPKFKVGERVQKKGDSQYAFRIAELRMIRGASGYRKFEYREVWTWWKEKELERAKR